MVAEGDQCSVKPSADEAFQGKNEPLHTTGNSALPKDPARGLTHKGWCDKSICMNYTFTRLQIGTTNSGKSISLMAPKSTADFYGWSEAFPVWTPPKTDIGDGRIGFRRQKPAVMNGEHGGSQFRICRSPKTAGYPAGYTNAFRLSANFRKQDIVAVAEATKVDWYWMVDPIGQKWFREQLLQLR